MRTGYCRALTVALPAIGIILLCRAPAATARRINQEPDREQIGPATTEDLHALQVVRTREDREKLGEEQLCKWIEALKACRDVTSEDVLEFHRRIDLGQTLTWHVRFGLGDDGRINSLQVIQGSGLETIDRTLLPEVCGLFVYDYSLSRSFQELKDLGAEVAISKRSLQFRLFGRGSSFEQAEEAERLEKAKWTERINSARFVQERRYFEQYQVSRNGREVSLSAELDWYTVQGHF